MSVPTKCPHCTAELTAPMPGLYSTTTNTPTVKPHCEGRTCGWVVCGVCDSRIDRKGRHCCGAKKECIDPSRRHR